MSDYTQLTDFSAKDSLASGDSEKIIYGSDIDEELSRISTAVASKVDEPSSPSTDDVLTYNGSAIVWQAGAAMPPGSIIPYAGITEPSGWLFCDGRSLAQASYAALYAVVTTSYGNSAGGANFDLPDLRFRVPVGPDNMGTAKGAASRSTSVTYASGTGDEGSTGGAGMRGITTTNMPSHSHTLSDSSIGGNAVATFAAGMYRNQANLGSSGTEMWNSSVGGTLQTLALSGSTEASGSGASFEIMQPFIVLNYLIKT